MNYEVAVVGLGAIGSATLYQLAKRGIRAVGIDRYDPPHIMGSSHGESRITRLSVGEGANVAPLVRRSHAIWRELEAATGQQLMRQTGGLILARREVGLHHGRDNFLSRCIGIAERFGIEHSHLDAEAIARRFPQFQLQGDETGLFEPEAGYLHPERCVATQLAQAASLGAAIQRNTRVWSVTPLDGAVRIDTDHGIVTADRCVVTAGPWVGQLTGPRMKSLTRVHRQALHWYPVEHAGDYDPERFPVFIWMHGAGPQDYFYGFPQLPGTQGVKLASEHYNGEDDPDTVSRDVTASESDKIHRSHVANRLRGLGAHAIRAAACLYTVTPDHDFIVDWLPETHRVLAVSACSGHAFKHSAGLGEAIAQTMADGASQVDLSPFAASRFA